MARKPAPTTAPVMGEPLAVELMNTVWADREGVYDALGTAAEATSWLAAYADRLSPRAAQATLTRAAAAQLRDLRDALRALAAEVTADPRPTAASSPIAHRTAVRTVNQAAARAPAWPELQWSAAKPTHTVRSAGSAAELAISELAAEGIDLFAGQLRAELRACVAPGCVLYFVRDHPRREWCSAACGNRARVARHYQRHHGGAGGSDRPAVRR